MGGARGGVLGDNGNMLTNLKVKHKRDMFLLLLLGNLSFPTVMTSSDCSSSFSVSPFIFLIIFVINRNSV